MSYTQKEIVRRMGFGAFLDIKFDSIPSRLTYYLVDKFTARTSTIKTKKGGINITKKKLTYADKEVSNGYNLRRSWPLIKHIDSVDLEMLEEHGLQMGRFGTLEFRGDEEVDLIDVDDDEDKLVDVETNEMLYCRICDDKKKIEEAIKKGLENDANDEEVKERSQKVHQLFYATTMEPGDNRSPTNEATMKTSVKVVVNSDQSNFVKGSSPICNVQSTGRNNEKTKVVDVCDSPSVLFLEYKGNTSLDSPVVLTPGFLNMSDEIVERSITKKKDFCKDDIPSFNSRITQLNKEDKNMDDMEGTKAVIRYTKKYVAEEKLKKRNGKDIMEGEKIGIMDVDEAVKDDENVVAQSIITWGKDKGEIIWKTIEGHGMHLEFAHTLAMRTKVHNNVIDALTAFLNKIKEQKSEASYSRMYFTCDTIVFIPIVVDDSYYLVCFCLKTVAFYIFDYIKRSGTIESAYGNRPRIVCQRKIVGVDCGIFHMRHMETYMGEAAHKWDCGLCVASKIQEKILGWLRYKYLYKLMMSDFNVMKQTFVKHYAVVKKMDRFERMKLIEGKKKEIIGVTQ
ncbi:unnamed protein product [Lactuca virosa]|uniref:Ubiquitin-like protease family profile domain-containing protein n=1 Tax=Lactuca virosa TaxID=75947 RepID=A0AAU9PSZ3_9ASTR|nr:unnamed protein product [Lactuca virosa]